MCCPKKFYADCFVFMLICFMKLELFLKAKKIAEIVFLLSKAQQNSKILYSVAVGKDKTTGVILKHTTQKKQQFCVALKALLGMPASRIKGPVFRTCFHLQFPAECVPEEAECDGSNRRSRLSSGLFYFNLAWARDLGNRN